MLQETTPLPKKGPSKVRGRARCFRQVINKTKIFFVFFGGEGLPRSKPKPKVVSRNIPR